MNHSTLDLPVGEVRSHQEKRQFSPSIGDSVKNLLDQKPNMSFEVLNAYASCLDDISFVANPDLQLPFLISLGEQSCKKVYIGRVTTTPTGKEVGSFKIKGKPNRTSSLYIKQKI